MKVAIRLPLVAQQRELATLVASIYTSKEETVLSYYVTNICKEENMRLKNSAIITRGNPGIETSYLVPAVGEPSRKEMKISDCARSNARCFKI